MSSVAQIQANRLNAQKSTGPRTPEGKEKASGELAPPRQDSFGLFR